MWSILFLDFASCISSLRTHPLVLSVSMSLTVGIATAILPNRPSDAEQGDTGNSTGVELGETLARHTLTCLNYTCLRA